MNIKAIVELRELDRDEVIESGDFHQYGDYYQIFPVLRDESVNLSPKDFSIHRKFFRVAHPRLTAARIVE